jgi:cytochrome c oxidase subunit III
VNEQNLSQAITDSPPEAMAPAGQTASLPIPPPVSPEKTLTSTQWGMVTFLVSEAAFFSTLVVAYLSFMGQDTVGPKPAEVLSMGLVIVTTICLLSSSVTIHQAEKALHGGDQGGFCRWWGLTILLGLVFILGTAYEWWELITEHGLTISSNLFGTTYYTLVGFHGLHVTAGLVVLSIILGLALKREVTTANQTSAQMVSWYWHFVDGVWIVVFTVVYLIPLLTAIP